MADEVYLIWSNEHRAWWGPGRHGYLTDTDKAGRYSEVEATEVVLNANRYRDHDLPPNEIMVLAPPRVDTSDIPETREAWFERARLLMVQLQDPVVVHLNMLRGTIAKPTWEQVKHLYPVELEDELNRDRLARRDLAQTDAPENE